MELPDDVNSRASEVEPEQTEGHEREQRHNRARPAEFHAVHLLNLERNLNSVGEDGWTTFIPSRVDSLVMSVKFHDEPFRPTRQHVFDGGENNQ